MAEKTQHLQVATFELSKQIAYKTEEQIHGIRSPNWFASAPKCRTALPFFTLTGMIGMFEGKDYSAPDI